MWDLQSIPDLSGKVYLVTGANSGIGYWISYYLSKNGAKVIMASRSQERLKGAIELIKRNITNADLEDRVVDLSSLESVKKFCDGIKKDYTHIDGLINNAALFSPEYSLSSDGIEMSMAVNHLGSFALTLQLIELVRHNSRIVNVSSIAHKRVNNFDIENLDLKNSIEYKPMVEYSKTKLANLLFTLELQNKLNNFSSNTLCLAAHPGVSATNIFTNYIEKMKYVGLAKKLAGLVYSLFFQESQKGSLPILKALFDENARQKDYYGPNGFMEMSGNPCKVKMSKKFINDENLKLLWKKSEDLTKIYFDDCIK